MKTDEIRNALCNTKLFDDVYSVDTLPARPRGLLVCNLDPSYRPGTHWVAIYVARVECERNTSTLSAENRAKR